MTEAEWLECNDPLPMLKFLPGKASDRKLRLFACACARYLWPLLTEKESRVAVEVAERFADGGATGYEMNTVEVSADDTTTAVYGTEQAAGTPPYCAADAAAWTATADASRAAIFAAEAVIDALDWDLRITERVILVRLLRDIRNNPFRPVSLGPAWRTPAVLHLAQAIYDDRAFDQLPILADALQEAGCTSREVLDHCRSPGPHVRGCWVVDLILGKG